MTLMRYLDMIVPRRFLEKFVRDDRKQIDVVHPSDLEAVLESLGELKRIEREDIDCFSCSDTVTKRNIGKLTVIDGEIRFLCDCYDCMFGSFRDSTDSSFDNGINPEKVVEIQEEESPEKERQPIDFSGSDQGIRKEDEMKMPHGDSGRDINET